MEKIWWDDISIWWDEWSLNRQDSTIEDIFATSIETLDPFKDMANEEAIKDCEMFFDTYIKSNGFTWRLDEFNRINDITIAKSNELMQSIKTMEIELKKVVDAWIIPSWEIITEPGSWYIYYKTDEGKYLISYGVPSRSYNQEEVNAWEYETQNLISLYSQLIENPEWTYNVSLIHPFDEAISLSWLILQNYINKKDTVELDLTVLWDILLILKKVTKGINIIDDIKNVKWWSKSLSESEIQQERVNRLSKLDKWEIHFIAKVLGNKTSGYYNPYNESNHEYNSDDKNITLLEWEIDSLNQELEKKSHAYIEYQKHNLGDKENLELMSKELENLNKILNQKTSLHSILHQKWDIVIYIEQWKRINIITLIHETVHKLLDWNKYKEMIFSYINQYFRWRKEFLMETYNENEAKYEEYKNYLDRVFHPEEIISNTISMRYCMYKLWCINIEDNITEDAYNDFIEKYNNLSEWETKESLKWIIRVMRKLFWRWSNSTQLDIEILHFFDAIFAQTDDMTTTYKNVA